MKVIARLPPREIEGAHQVLEGVVGECISGNYCRFWPAMTYDDQTNQTRIAFFTEWFRPATPADMEEFMAFTNAMMQSSSADRQAEAAKEKAKVLLATDIDILVFVTMIGVMHSPGPVDLMNMAVAGLMSCRDAAITLVKIMEEALKRDKQARSG